MTLTDWLNLNRPRQRQDFAREIGTSGAHLSRIERGRDPGPDLARRIVGATAGAVTLDDLYGLAAEQPGDAA